MATPDDESDARSKRFLRLVATAPIEAIRSTIAADPRLVDVSGPHPFWGGRPQPLHVAIETGRTDVFTLLLEAGADVHGAAAEYAGWSPLMLAAYRGRSSMSDASSPAVPPSVSSRRCCSPTTRGSRPSSRPVEPRRCRRRRRTTARS